MVIELEMEYLCNIETLDTRYPFNSQILAFPPLPCLLEGFWDPF